MGTSRTPPSPEQVLTVSALTAEVRRLLADRLSDLWVRGEISQPRRSAAGHLYLTLKDEEAVLPCVMWRSGAGRLRFRVEEGQEVLAHGALDVYPPHGRYQLVIRRLEPLGAGALQLAFEQLRARLAAEGLFDAERKRPLPRLPRRIALVTSPTGAAVRDLVSVIHRRLPSVALLLVPVRVQGEGAAEEIARGLERADRQARADVIVVGRGGGSLEDLWAFNEETVARAIAACRTPVVSAVGHETDVTIADLVADVRAATPSQAGELVVPVLQDLLAGLAALEERLRRHLRAVLSRAWQQVEALAERPALGAPRALLGRRRERLEHLAARLGSQSPVASLRRRAEALSGLAARIAVPLPRRLRRERETAGAVAERLAGLVRRRTERARDVLEGLGHRLRALSPLAVLGRGYSLTTDADGRVVRRAADVREGMGLLTRLGDRSRIASRVEEVAPPPEDEA